MKMIKRDKRDSACLRTTLCLRFSLLAVAVNAASGAAGGEVDQLPAAPAEAESSQNGQKTVSSRPNESVNAILSPVPSYEDQGVLMVPMRPVCDFLDVDVTSHDGILTLSRHTSSSDGRSSTRSITLRTGGKSAQITDDKGETKTEVLPLAAETRLGNTFLPMMFLTKAFDATIAYRVPDNAIVIRTAAKTGVLTPPVLKDYTGRDAATLTIVNRVGRALSLRLGGPASLVCELGRNHSITRRMPPGVYYFKAGSSGMRAREGARRLHAGRRVTWSWGRR